MRLLPDVVSDWQLCLSYWPIVVRVPRKLFVKILMSATVYTEIKVYGQNPLRVHLLGLQRWSDLPDTHQRLRHRQARVIVLFSFCALFLFSVLCSSLNWPDLTRLVFNSFISCQSILNVQYTMRHSDKPNFYLSFEVDISDVLNYFWL